MGGLPLPDEMPARAGVWKASCVRMTQQRRARPHHTTLPRRQREGTEKARGEERDMQRDTEAVREGGREGGHTGEGKRET